MEFEDVAYKIKNRNKNEREILKGISGTVAPGEMLAMLGPSGSGKTTLLTVLGGRILHSRISGNVAYNGLPFSNAVKRNIGFVTQDDVLHPHLTVAETLVYTALLRLPSELPREAKVMRAEAVLARVGLAACRDGIVGSTLVRGVSGGERKRVSIAQEMLVDPSLLMLDEPTSGLDSTIAGMIVSTLWELAGAGKTVVMTIHQPSSRLFYMFHKILLLSDGNPIYFGKGSEAMGYFARIGYAPTLAMNPADFLLDLANGVSSDETSEERASTKQALAAAYRQHLHDQVREEISNLGQHSNEHDSGKKMTSEWCTTWWDQFTVLLQRDLKERKHEAFSWRKIAQVLAVALLSGILWFHSEGHVQDQVGLLFFVAGFWVFYPVFEAIFTFPPERALLTKERSSGMYRLSSYFVARMAGDLPMELILPIVFITITYWMGGLKPLAANFCANLAVVLLGVLAAQGFGLALGALVMNLKAATTLGSVLMLSFLLAGGFYVQNIPPFIAWIKYISLLYYTFKLQIISQYSAEDTYQCTPTVRCPILEFPSIKMVGFGDTVWTTAVLVIMLFAYRFVAYLGLMRVGVAR
ncbi:ABC transporter G family member 9 [Curcuma longa]|uniref:ABC transporter G family member 9 n=1 Tax=Curcuma longa TaxID=136217 RepID=UPI003D9F77AD